MTIKELLGQVVGSLEQQQQELNTVDPEHPTHGTDLLNKFQAAYNVAPSDPNADLGQAFQQISGAVSGQGQGFTSKAYGDAFAQGAQAFQGRPNQLSASDLGPLIGMLVQGFANHDTRGVNSAGALGSLGPLLSMLTGSQGGGNLGSLIGGLMGGGNSSGAGGGLGSVLGGLMGGNSGVQGQQSGSLGNVLGGLLGGSQPQQTQNSSLGGLLGGLAGAFTGGTQQSGAASGGMGDILGQLMGAVQQGSQMTNANGQRDAGAASTGTIVSSVLGALLGGR